MFDSNTNVLLMIRASSGSGKSSLAKFLHNNFFSSVTIHEADLFMHENGVYKFAVEKLGYAHKSCQRETEESLKAGTKLVIVSNTSTREQDVQIYKELAEKYNYKFVSLVLEKYHENSDLHGVPLETRMKQAASLRGSIKLL